MTLVLSTLICMSESSAEPDDMSDTRSSMVRVPSSSPSSTTATSSAYPRRRMSESASGIPLRGEAASWSLRISSKAKMKKSGDATSPYRNPLSIEKVSNFTFLLFELTMTYGDECRGRVVKNHPAGRW